jgi:ABC-2 type transport system permease protein
VSAVSPPRQTSERGVIAIIVQELLQRRWAVLWWVLGIGAYITLNLAVYPTIRNQSAQLDTALRQIPNTAKALITDSGSFITPIGYLSSKVYYFFLPLLLSFLAIALGSSLLGREEQQHTLELLFARPLSRGSLLLGKAVAGLLFMLAVTLPLAILGAAEAKLFGFTGIQLSSILLTTLISALLSMVFGSVSFALTAAGRTGRGASIGIAVLLALGGYVISSLDQTIHWLRWPAKFLPYHYYHPSELLAGHYSFGEPVGMAIVVIILIVIAWLAFRRRDIS